MKISTLTPVERLQLINQFLILEKVDPEHEEDYGKGERSLRTGTPSGPLDCAPMYADLFGDYLA